MTVQVNGKTQKKTWVSQLPVDYLDTSLTINTWETVSADLSGGSPARLHRVIVEQTNNGAAAEDLEIELTINGTAFVCALGASDDGVRQFVRVSDSLDTGNFDLVGNDTQMTVGETYDTDISKAFNAETVGLIRVRQTSAVDGVAAQIEVNIVWEKQILI